MTRLRLTAPFGGFDDGRIGAAQYLRMSTEMQTYSIEHQKHAVAAFADAQGYRITHTYADPGRSGLTLEGRPALKALLEDIERGADFEAVLIYDVSRWGRFQDVDESAFYEFRCRRAGVKVVYVAEPFQFESGPLGSIVKSMKRLMAAEYSRELSARISLGKRRLSALGYWQSGRPSFGLRRQVVGYDGQLKQVLQDGEWNAIHGDRVVLAHGDPDDVALVRRVFELYCRDGLNRDRITDRLIDEGIPEKPGGPWCPQNVRTILMNETYTGSYLYGKKPSHRRGSTLFAPPDTLIQVEASFDPIIDRQTFDLAQRIRVARSGRMSREDALGRLRVLLRTHGKLTTALIDEDLETPSAYFYRRRFGSLLAAYEAVGWEPPRDLTAYVFTGEKRRALNGSRRARFADAAKRRL